MELVNEVVIVMRVFGFHVFVTVKYLTREAIFIACLGAVPFLCQIVQFTIRTRHDFPSPSRVSGQIRQHIQQRSADARILLGS